MKLNFVFFKFKNYFPLKKIYLILFLNSIIEMKTLRMNFALLFIGLFSAAYTISIPGISL